jgi:hypothetical protein
MSKPYNYVKNHQNLKPKKIYIHYGGLLCIFNVKFLNQKYNCCSHCLIN